MSERRRRRRGKQAEQSEHAVDADWFSQLLGLRGSLVEEVGSLGDLEREARYETVGGEIDDVSDCDGAVGAAVADEDDGLELGADSEADLGEDSAAESGVDLGDDGDSEPLGSSGAPTWAGG